MEITRDEANKALTDLVNQANITVKDSVFEDVVDYILYSLNEG